MLASTLKSCQKLKKLDLTTFHVWNDDRLGLTKLADVKPKFTQLNARIHSQNSPDIDMILCLLNNAPTVAAITIDGIESEEFMDKFVAAGISLSEKVQHNVELNLKWSRSTSNDNKDKVPKELPTNMPGNLTVAVHFSD